MATGIQGKAPRMGRWPALLIAFSGLLLLGNAAAYADDDISGESRIKAAFLYNFAKYVEWPAQSFPSPDSPIVIGVYCPAPLASVLGKIVEGRTISGREIAVKTLTTAPEARTVQMVYVCTDNEALWGPIKVALNQAPTLTVANSESPGNSGAAIHFVMAGDKVRFSIDMDDARRAGLKISDQLQKLAVSVTRTP